MDVSKTEEQIAQIGMRLSSVHANQVNTQPDERDFWHKPEIVGMVKRTLLTPLCTYTRKYPHAGPWAW